MALKLPRNTTSFPHRVKSGKRTHAIRVRISCFGYLATAKRREREPTRRIQYTNFTAGIRRRYAALSTFEVVKRNLSRFDILRIFHNNGCGS